MRNPEQRAGCGSAAHATPDSSGPSSSRLRSSCILRRVASLLDRVLVSGRTPSPPPKRDVRFCAGGDVSLGTNLDTCWARNRFDGNGRDCARSPIRASSSPRSLRSSPTRASSSLNVEGAIGSGPAPRKCAPPLRALLCAAPAAVRRRGPSAPERFRDRRRQRREQPRARRGRRRASRDATPARRGRRARHRSRHARDAGADRGRRHARRARVQPVEHRRRHRPRRGPAHRAARRGTIRPRDRHDAHRRRRRGRATHAGPGRALRGREPGQQRRVRARGGRERREPRHRKRTSRAARPSSGTDDALVAHSLGNLVTYGPFNHSGYNDHGALLCATLGARRVGPRRRAAVHGAARAGLRAGGPRRISARATWRNCRRQDFPVTGAEISPGGEIKPRPR